MIKTWWKIVAQEKSLKTKSVVQKLKYNKNCDRVCVDVWAPCLIALTIIYLIYTYCKQKNFKAKKFTLLKLIQLKPGPYKKCQLLLDKEIESLPQTLIF